MKCINIFGHKWGRWQLGYGAPSRYTDDKFYREMSNSRVCQKCSYVERVFHGLHKRVDHCEDDDIVEKLEGETKQ